MTGPYPISLFFSLPFEFSDDTTIEKIHTQLKRIHFFRLFLFITFKLLCFALDIPILGVLCVIVFRNKSFTLLECNFSVSNKYTCQTEKFLRMHAHTHRSIRISCDFSTALSLPDNSSHFQIRALMSRLHIHLF